MVEMAVSALVVPLTLVVLNPALLAWSAVVSRICFRRRYYYLISTMKAMLAGFMNGVGVLLQQATQGKSVETL
jgi:uncharacterized membrane protein